MSPPLGGDNRLFAVVVKSAYWVHQEHARMNSFLLGNVRHLIAIAITSVKSRDNGIIAPYDNEEGPCPAADGEMLHEDI